MKKLYKYIAVILCFVLVSFSFIINVKGYSTVGSRGNEVRNIQQRLKSWGYYTGAVDGI